MLAWRGFMAESQADKACLLQGKIVRIALAKSHLSRYDIETLTLSLSDRNNKE
jgi:hypothetical protein